MTVYGRTKLMGTQEVMARSAEGGLRALTARLFTVYGPGEHQGRLLPSLIDASQTGRPIQLSMGTQRRDFTYVEDVAQGLLRLGLSNAEPGWIVNLATGRLVSVREFAHDAARVLGMPLELMIFGAVSTRPEEMHHDEVSVERLQSLTGWHPATTVTQGVRATVAFRTSGQGVRR
jgi:nucleoside-diphosphate-sugar epimerase